MYPKELNQAEGEERRKKEKTTLNLKHLCEL
jgi:hypothetical protein